MGMPKRFAKRTFVTCFLFKCKAVKSPNEQCCSCFLIENNNATFSNVSIYEQRIYFTGQNPQGLFKANEMKQN